MLSEVVALCCCSADAGGKYLQSRRRCWRHGSSGATTGPRKSLDLHSLIWRHFIAAAVVCSILTLRQIFKVAYDLAVCLCSHRVLRATVLATSAIRDGSSQAGVEQRLSHRAHRGVW